MERLLLRAKEKGRLPKYLLLENVKNLIGKKFKADYEKWLAFLNSLGYHNYWKVLNAKHYGIPQNRERVFCVSCLDEIDYKFPETFSLILRLRDMLEEKVDEKYFISSEKAIAMLNSHFQIRRKSVMGEDAVTPSLMARDHKEPRCVVIGSLDDEKYSKMMECSRRVYDIEGISPTIHTCQGGNTEPKIAAMRGRNPENPSSRVAGEPTEQRLEFNENGTTNAITTVQKDNLVVCEERRDEGIRMFNDGCCGALRTIDACGDKRVMEVGGLYTEDSPRFHRPPLENLSRTLKAGLHDAGVQISEGNIIRIRKLTPTECLRLMGWKDTQIDKIREAGLSGTQMYKQAGNGIVVNVLEAIFKNLLINLGE